MSEAVQSIQTPQTTYLNAYEVPHFFIDTLDLNFELNEAYTRVKSTLHVRRNLESKSEKNELVLNGEDLTLESIHLDGVELSPEQYVLNDALLIINHVPEEFDLTIVTKIYPQNNTALSGLYRSRNTYCTQCEAEGFRRITYFLDRPDILTTYTTTISADESRYPFLLSNGNVIGRGKLENGYHWVTWVDPFKKPSYLFALVAGDFDVIHDSFTTMSGRTIALRIYVEKGYGDQAQHAMYSLKEAMRWDEKTYGREYDLDIYMIVAISDFNMSAMENKGLNIFNTKYVLAKPETATDDDYIHILSVVGHEYFHNWSGNRITCRDWFQLSLKEGLTIFRDQQFTGDCISQAVMRIHDVTALRESQFPEDAGPLAHPVRPESYIEINNFYTTTVYNKGAEVLRMLRTLLGKTVFRKGMDLYFTRHDGQAVTIEDYIKVMEEVSNIDLTQFRRWYSQAGTPVVNVSDDYDSVNNVYTLTMNQICPKTPGQNDKLPFYIPIRMGLIDTSGNAMLLQVNEDDKPDYEKVLALTDAAQQFQFKNITSCPTPSLMRDFSAPVILKYPYSDNNLLFLFQHDKDPFNRFEAGQQYVLRVMLNLIRDYQQEKPLSFPGEFADAYGYVLNESGDPFLAAEMLRLPSENYIGEQMAIVDVVAIHNVREFIKQSLAKHLEPLLLEVYRRYHTNESYQFNTNAVGQRHLKNRCLDYLLLLTQHTALGKQQFDDSLQRNMTDTQAALVGLNNINSPLRDTALEQFYAAFKGDALVVDKWFAIQAASYLPNTLQQVKKLTRHEAFDIKNPNNVYALIATFGMRNPINFHVESGEGYAFLRDIVKQLDELNPQIAARMVKPLTHWQRYDKERARLMREQLEILKQDKKISPDLYEMVAKSLASNIKEV